jgi:preprotein translocase subunit SecD
MRLTISIIGIALLLVVCGSSCVPNVNPPVEATPTVSSGALVVFTTWVADSKATGGPEPGYKPALTALTGHDIKTATASINTDGTIWLVNVSFTPRGASLFAKLTHDNVSACPGNPMTTSSASCAQRHLGVWLGLIQADVDNWDDASYTAKVSQPYDLACVTHRSPTTVCPKFLSNPITLQEITGGSTEIGCPCTEQGAKDLAAAIDSAR